MAGAHSGDDDPGSCQEVGGQLQVAQLEGPLLKIAPARPQHYGDAVCIRQRHATTVSAPHVVQYHVKQQCSGFDKVLQPPFLHVPLCESLDYGATMPGFKQRLLA